jgi:ABC-type multidrug transport system ATPase subunit
VTLRVRGVTKRFGARAVLAGASFELVEPGVTALLGDNGAGKSTLLRIVGGIVAPDDGAISICDVALDRRAAALRQLGYLPESATPFPHLSVDELLRLVAALKRAPVPARDLYERLGVDRIRVDRIGSLSLGQRRRACLLAALVGEPRVLVLDEPTNGLDPDGVTMLLELLRDQRDRGVITLVATHDLAFARAVSGRMLRIADGRVDECAGPG